MSQTESQIQRSDPAFPGILARTGAAQGGAVVHRIRPARGLINPTITPGPQIVVVVKKSYTNPARVQITLRASRTVRQDATLTRIMTGSSGNIKLFDARTGGAEITFTQSPSNPTESTFTIPFRQLNLGKRLFAESDSPCTNLDDYRLRLSLAAGPTSGDPAEVTIVAVSVNLDISPPRSAPGVDPQPLPQPPATPPAPGSTPTDKWFGGIQLNTQDPGKNQKRAQLRALAQPSDFGGDLILRQVRVSGTAVGALDNNVRVFEEEIPGPRQTPPVAETQKPNPFEFSAASAAPVLGKTLFAEGAVASSAVRDTGFQLGVKNVEPDGDRVAITVAVGPVLTADHPIVVVKKPHTNPARRVISVRASTAFGRTGTLTRSAAGPPIRLLNVQRPAAGTEIIVTGAGHTVSAADLSRGVQFFAESTVPSGGRDDYELTLTLAAGSTPVGAPVSIKLTAVELTLDVAQPRVTPNVVPPLFSAAEKVNPGRFIQASDPGFSHQRAMIILRPPNPDISLTTVLSATSTRVPAPANPQVQAFGIEEPFAGQGAHPNPATFPKDLLTPGGGMQLFVEGTTASAAVRDTGFRFGIEGIENECDRVVMTALGDLSQPGPYIVGQFEYTEAQEGSFNLPLPGGGGGVFPVRRRAIIRYPAEQATVGADVSALDATYPLILILHGNHRRFRPGGAFVQSYRGLEYLCSHLASYGFIALSIDADDINQRANSIPQRGEAILEHLQVMIRRNTAVGLFRGRIDLAHIGLIGHSRGGEGVLAAQQLNISRALGHNIRGIVSIAPTNSEDFVHNSTPYLVIYGSSDGDVSGADNSVNPFLIYDRAAAPKAMIFIYAAIHNRFSTNTDWLDVTQIDNDDARMIAEADHLNIARNYTAAFFERHFRQFLEFDSQFKRNGRPASRQQ